MSDPNPESVIVVFGDVHGRADLLAKLIETANAKYGEVEYVTLGDLIDRGPDSKGVIQLCVDHKISGVMGNHELWLLDALEPHGEVDGGVTSRIMGGVATLSSYGVTSFAGDEQARQLRYMVPAEHQKFLKSLHHALHFVAGGKTWYLVHGGVNTSVVTGIRHTVGEGVIGGMSDVDLLTALVKTSLMTMLWAPAKVGGDHTGMYRFKGGIQLLGHSPVPEPIDGGHYIALDTGCGTCSPNMLSGVAIKPDGTYETFSVR